MVSALLLNFAQTSLLTPQPPVEVPGGAGRFDFMNIDTRNGYVFACHPGKQSLAVLDIAKNSATDVAVGTQVNGCSADTRGKVVYAAGPGKTLVKVDETTWKVVATLPLDGPGDCVQYDRRTKTAYVCNDDGTNIWAVDGDPLKVRGAVTIAEAPEYMELDSQAGLAYQAIKSNNTVQVVDLKTLKVTADWKLGDLTGPHGLCFDRQANRVFVAGKNGKLVMLNTQTGQVVTTIDVVTGSDQIAMDTSNKRIYIPSQSQLQVVQVEGDTLKVAGSVPVAKDCHRVTVDRKTHTVYVAYVNDGKSWFQAFTAN